MWLYFLLRDTHSICTQLVKPAELSLMGPREQVLVWLGGILWSPWNPKILQQSLSAQFLSDQTHQPNPPPIAVVPLSHMPGELCNMALFKLSKCCVLPSGYATSKPSLARSVAPAKLLFWRGGKKKNHLPSSTPARCKQMAPFSTSTMSLRSLLWQSPICTAVQVR